MLNGFKNSLPACRPLSDSALKELDRLGREDARIRRETAERLAKERASRHARRAHRQRSAPSPWSLR